MKSRHHQPKSLNQRHQNACPRGVGILCDFHIDHAENATLWDTSGREFIDFSGGIAVLNVGHRHPKVVAAIQAQLARFIHTAYQIVPYESYIHLAERINALAPITGKTKTAFFSTGAEAVENAIKIARSYTGRSGVIAFAGAFHGRTITTLGLTGKVNPYKLGFGPFPNEFYHVPFPNALHGISEDDSLNAIQQLFKYDIEPERIAAIIIEPIQGEGGFNIASSDFFQALRNLCDTYGILLIADEIQTGFGRTGKYFAMEHHYVEPDLVTIAKSLAGGMPLSGVVGHADIMDAPLPGGLGGTYAGNPLAIASAHAVLDILVEEKLLSRSATLGSILQTCLVEHQKRNPNIIDVRGVGAMVAVEFTDATIAKKVQQYALAQHLLLLTCGVNGNVIRFLFPLTIPDEQFTAALDILSRALISSETV